MKHYQQNENTTPYSKEELYRIALDHFHGSCVIMDRSGKILYCNETSAGMLGVAKDWYLSTDMQSIMNETAMPRSAGLEALQTRACVRYYTPTQQGEGMLISAIPILNDAGEAELVITFSLDEGFLDTYTEEMKADKRRFASALQYVTGAKYEQNIVAESASMQQILQTARNIAPSAATVSLYGESGVGKEVLASYIHKYSIRADQIFLPVNCSAIPADLVESEFFGYEKGAFTGAVRDGKPGLFEVANGGTIFLDEIGDLPLMMQAKLLRVLENGEVRRIGSNAVKKVDVRVICATNRNMMELVNRGDFRSDLYYRLNVIPLYIPPLRERHDDLLALAQRFLQHFNRKYGYAKVFSAEALQAFQQYSWPGNVRELRNMVERMVITTSGTQLFFENPLLPQSRRPAQAADAPDEPQHVHHFTPTLPLREALHDFEKHYLATALQACDGDLRETAALLGIHLSGLYSKVKSYHLKDEKE